MGVEWDDGDEEARALAHRLAQIAARLRQERGWTLEDLADEAGLHRTYIGLVERGERHLSIAAAHRVATALGVPLSVLAELAEAELAGKPAAPRFHPRLVNPEHLCNAELVEGITGLGDDWVREAIEETYARLDIIDERLLEAGSPPLAGLVELANLSSMIGNVLRSALATASQGTFIGNTPHTYPDLVSQRQPVPDVEIKIALEANKPKGHLPKPGLHMTVRYVLGDRDGNYTRGKENRGDVAWIYEMRLGDLGPDDFALSNTEGDSGKTAVIRTDALDRLPCIYFDPAHNPYARQRPSQGGGGGLV